MNNFNASDFNECRSEEVMFHLTLSVLKQGVPLVFSEKNGKSVSHHFSSLKILADELEEYIKDSHS